MNKYNAIFFYILFFGSACITMKLPNYINECHRDDPKLEECALESARASMPRFAKGDPERGLPSLDPLHIEELKVHITQNKEGLNIVFRNNEFTGFENLHLDYLKFDFDKKMIQAEGMVNFVLKSQYEISGKLLVLPVHGNGDSVIKLKNTTLDVKYWYEDVIGPEGKTHWNIIEHELKYEVGRVTFRLENLFNADKRIGDQINRLLNELWRETVVEVGPTIAKFLNEAVLHNLQILLQQTSYDDFMPPMPKLSG